MRGVDEVRLIVGEVVPRTLIQKGVKSFNDNDVMVLCKEKVGDGGSALMATNLFEKCEDGAWRLVLHQAGPIGMP